MPPDTTIVNNNWAPRVHRETRDLMEHLNLGEDQQLLLDESVGLLGKCVPPTTPSGSRTGLVVGYIQSGKTASFTTVTALARDNGYQLVIVITGTSVPLFKQSSDRLLSDLRLIGSTSPLRERKWQHFLNPTSRQKENFEEVLTEWRDPDVPDDDRQAILVTVMKNHYHLRSLGLLLSNLDLEGVPTLVIDDEADQAGLNTLARVGDESTTYGLMLAIRQSINHHTFLQYTATPQAPLLISLIDVLSPDFVHLLTPGAAYTGGHYFFVDHPELIETIPEPEILSNTNHLDTAPESLTAAMRLFFLGVAVGYVRGDTAGKNRSMMIHPSQRTEEHRRFRGWVSDAKEEWKRVLELDNASPERQQLLADFQLSYTDLSSTVDESPTFDEITPKLLYAVRRTRIEEINTREGQTPIIEWRTIYSRILIGGQAINRGFTVEGLTITYMPRGLGVGNADTVQQRARFFGYRQSYAGYCRVFLDEPVRAAYTRYVEHEEDVRTRLRVHIESGRPLAEWKRAFLLTRDLRPTRRNVLESDYMQGNIFNKWLAPSSPHISDEITASNQQIIDNFIVQHTFEESPGDDQRTPEQRHTVATGIPLRNLYAEVLVRMRIPWPIDFRKYIGALLQMHVYLEENLDTNCTVYLMGGGSARIRSVGSSGGIKKLFQGSNTRTGYPGDRYIRSDEGLTIQIHKLNLRNSGEQIATEVPLLAIWMPEEMSADWVAQHQDHQST